MPADYKLIRKDNERRYGTDIGRFGQALLANRYDERTHFIFELLQNAEDALGRRENWTGSRSVAFELSNGTLKFSHFGKPFDEADVRGICGIDESTKKVTDIGTFGIGFKSVYAFTDRPEIHSGDEDFVIENFVWPASAPSSYRDPNETIIQVPLTKPIAGAEAEIATALRQLGPRTLLFLRHLDEISWTTADQTSGLYMRTEPVALDDGVRQVALIGQESDAPIVEETWLVFSRPVRTQHDEPAGFVEIAFALEKSGETGEIEVTPISDSKLVVYFPTVIETHMGFLIQGPYQTTPSRDNVPRREPWNQQLVLETADLLKDSLRWLRDKDMLDVGALEALPLDSARFSESDMFWPIFTSAREILASEPLLPKFGSGYVSAANAKLARARELQDLISPYQLKHLFEAEDDLFWLSGEITQDRTPRLREYLMQMLDVQEVTANTVVSRLDEKFLAAQTDDWIIQLYGFLKDRPALLKALGQTPLIRLEDGSHTPAVVDKLPQAFLPADVKTEFPTVRKSICASEVALEFLKSLGLTEPDTVDDVIRNVLPKYNENEISIEEKEYESDINRILAAFKTDSTSQKQKLTHALRESAFVMAIDPGSGAEIHAEPENVYINTERLRELFSGVPGVLLVDNDYDCLRGEPVRELLESCGATRYPQPVQIPSNLSWQDRHNLRVSAGTADYSNESPPEDFSLRGLNELLETLPKLNAEERSNKAALLWQSLIDLRDRRGNLPFRGTYKWFYFHQRSTTFDAAFVRTLNEREWVPSENGKLRRPGDVSFEMLGWKPDHFLLERIKFKPAAIDRLAKEVGIDPGVLDLLKQQGLTGLKELMARLGIKDSSPAENNDGTDNTPPPPNYEGSGEGEEDDGSPSEGDGTDGEYGSGTGSGGGNGSGRGKGKPSEGDGDKKPRGSDESSKKGKSGGRDKFVSYVAVTNEDDEDDPDNLTSEARMALEEKAIAFILEGDPSLERTPAGNEGFDLFESDESGHTIRLVEVKSMTCAFTDRPVGLSRSQFEHAQEHGEAYWLYVVENADADNRRIIKIQDPAGKARTFTFDQGWINAAEPEE